MKFQLTQISILVSALFLAAGANAQSTTDVGTIQVQGAPGGADTGLIQQEESPRARSSVNRKSIENQNPVNNPYQVINLLPGVSQFSQDGTGLFGGSLRIRGFNSDQLGFTINGAPVNDSGSLRSSRRNTPTATTSVKCSSRRARRTAMRRTSAPPAATSA